MMVQAGIRKIYYFPASEGEIDWESASSPVRDPNQSFGDELRSPLTTGSSTVSRKEKQEKNKRSVHRLIQNNSIAMALYIPQWLHSDWKLSLEGEAELAAKYTIPDDWGWHLDNSIGSSPSISDRWPSIQAKFNKTLLAMHILETRYKTHICRLKCGEEVGTEPSKDLHRHAIILAHIAARRTDDPKVGVGAVLINHEGQYMSVGWNGYPKKTQHLDYPHAGADDCVEDEELKYDYILHAEQNALLWRNPTGVKLNPDTVLVSTKMPCDECSPVMSDCGVRSVVTVPQAPKASDDPARLRGLTYEKLSKLVTDIAIFQL